MKALKPRLTILLYHGVTAHRSVGVENYSGKHIGKSEFESQMSFLRERNLAVSLTEVLNRYEQGKFFDRDQVAVTFDDGFRNNATVAAPILERHGIPAIFYVSTGMIGSSRMFWVDQIEDLINRSEKSEICVLLGDKRKLFSLSTNHKKVFAIEEIKSFCKRASDSDKNQVIAALALETGVSPSIASSPNSATMSWNDVRALDRSPLFLIGGHSIYHRILSRLPEDEMHREIDGSLQTLERELAHPVIHYAYPEGQAEHYNESVIAHLKNKGIRCCPSAIFGRNGADESLFHLRRIMVGFNGREFPFPEWTTPL